MLYSKDQIEERLKRFKDTKKTSYLIGIDESQYIEFKREFYDLTKPDEYYSGAKDISSFVNSSDGGFLIFGVTTPDSQGKLIDTSQSLAVISDCTSGLKGLIKQALYPKIREGEGYRVNYVETDNRNHKGVVIVEIMGAPDRPVLIKKVIDGDTQIPEIVFGYAKRKGDSSEPDSLEELYKKMSSGFNVHNQITEQISLDVSSIKEQISQLGEHHAQGGKQSRLDERMDE